MGMFTVMHRVNITSPAHKLSWVPLLSLYHVQQY